MPIAASELKEVQRIFEGDTVKVSSRDAVDTCLTLHNCKDVGSQLDTLSDIFGKWLPVMDVQPFRNGWMVAVPYATSRWDLKGRKVAYLYQDSFIEVQPSAARAKKMQQDAQNAKAALGVLPKFFKQNFTWDVVKKIAVDKASNAVLSGLLAPFGLNDVVKDIAIEVIGGVCRIVFRAVVDKKPIDADFLKDTVKDVLQGCIQALALDVVVDGIFGDAIADELDECVDDVKAVAEVAEEEKEAKRQTMRTTYNDTQFEITGAGSSEVDGIYIWDDDLQPPAFVQQDGRHILRYWDVCDGCPEGWYVCSWEEGEEDSDGMFEFGCWARYFAPGGEDVVPLSRWEVCTGDFAEETTSPVPSFQQSKL